MKDKISRLSQPPGPSAAPEGGWTTTATVAWVCELRGLKAISVNELASRAALQGSQTRERVVQPAL